MAARLGTLLLPVAAVVLLASTFLDWFGEKANTHGLLVLIYLGDTGHSAWEALDVVPIVLVATTVAALATTAARRPGHSRRLLLATDAATAVLAAASAVLVLSQIIDPPVLLPFDDPRTGIEVETTTKLPIWIALASALTIGLRASTSLLTHRRS